jgi:hypothetical protein
LNTRIVLVWCSVVIAVAAMIGLCGAQAHSARRVAGAELMRLDHVSSQANSVASLRASVPAPAGRNTVQGGLAPRVSAALVGAGIPASALSGLSPEADVPLDRTGNGRKRRRATLTLASVTLPQVGILLETWRQREPEWTVSSLDLSPQSGAAPSANGDLPLRVVVVLESVDTAITRSDR